MGKNLVDEISEMFDMSSIDKPMMTWYCAEGDELRLVQSTLSLIGFDENGDAYVSAEYGQAISSVVDAAKADREPVVYRDDMPFVRVGWLRRRFPACEAVFEQFGLRFA